LRTDGAYLRTNDAYLRTDGAYLRTDGAYLRTDGASVHTGDATGSPHKSSGYPNKSSVHPNKSSVHPNKSSVHPNKAPGSRHKSSGTARAVQARTTAHGWNVAAVFGILKGMKVWLKLLSCAIVGVILGMALPLGENGLLTYAIEFLSQIALRIGRYIAPPLVLFSLTVAIHRLRQAGKFWSLVGKSFLMILATTALVLTFGVGVTRLFFSSGRIPIIVENSAEVAPLNPEQSAFELFPSNMLSVPAGNGLFLLPLGLFAFFLAIGFSYDKAYSKPLVSLCDSLSRIFFHIAAFFSELLGIVVIVLASYYAWQYRLTLTSGVFSGLVRLLLIITLSLSFVVFPLLLYLFHHEKRRTPWKKLYGSLGPAIAAFFSGDINFALPVLIIHNKENLGVNRRVNAVVPLLYTAIGRAGSAMVAAVSFIVILQSYSSLEIGFGQIMQIWGRAFLLSLMLGRNSGDGAIVALATLCLWAPEGFKTGYLILRPIGFLLVACATLIDCMAAAIGSYAIARISPFRPSDEKSVKRFI
jgi:Na+/H+-dicarboxylate symporter